VVVGIAVVLAFALLERYPARAPSWLPRWILQIVGVVIAVPGGVLLAHSISMAIDIDAAHTPAQMTGLVVLLVEGLLLAPWIALGALVRQKEALARERTLALELARSEMERQALDTRLNLLQAQVRRISFSTRSRTCRHLWTRARRRPRWCCAVSLPTCAPRSRA
jgi:hypothetical protein